MREDWPTWRLISEIELASSSEALETVCTLLEASSAAVLTACACCAVCSELADSDCAEFCICVDAEDTASTTPMTCLSKVSASFTCRVITAQVSIGPT